jgi:RIO kinase 1
MNSQLDLLLSEGIIDEVLGRLKSGKEAEVFRVVYRGQTVAAKVYKDRQQRSFQHNVAYKEGRKVRNSRTQRAIDKGSRFGRDEAEDAWKSSEAGTLQLLHRQGVRVPTPVLFYEGVLLMELVSDADGDIAPRLIEAAIDAESAGPLYRDLRGQIIKVLCCDLIHGDLSPYNVLLGAAGPTIIDFPQAISAAHNSQSEGFFQRDFENILNFFIEHDRRLAAHRGDGREIWRAYTRRDLSPDYVPMTRAPAPPPRAPQPQYGGDQRPRFNDRQPSGQRPDDRQYNGQRPDDRQYNGQRPNQQSYSPQRPSDQRPPQGQRPHDPAFSGQRPGDQRPNDPRPGDQRPSDPRYNDQRPSDPRYNDQRRSGPRYNDQRPNDPRQQGQRPEVQPYRGQRPNDPRAADPRPQAQRPEDQRPREPRSEDQRPHDQHSNDQRSHDQRSHDQRSPGPGPQAQRPNEAQQTAAPRPQEPATEAPRGAEWPSRPRIYEPPPGGARPSGGRNEPRNPDTNPRPPRTRSRRG